MCTPHAYHDHTNISPAQERAAGGGNKKTTPAFPSFWKLVLNLLYFVVLVIAMSYMMLIIMQASFMGSNLPAGQGVSTNFICSASAQDILWAKKAPSKQNKDMPMYACITETGLYVFMQ